MHLSALKLGAVFCAWGVLVAIFAVFGAPALKDRYGTARTLIASLILIAVRRTLDDADAGENLSGHSAVREAEKEAVTEIPAEPDEAILAEHAFRKDRQH